MQFKKIFLLIIFLLTTHLNAQASQSTKIDLKPLKVGAGQTSNYSFRITNQSSDPIYILRIETPDNSDIKFSQAISCPEDKNKNDKYDWAISQDKNHMTCKTSASSDNPNLISFNELGTIQVRATAPSICQNTNYNFKIIHENTSNFTQITNNNATINVIANPPSVTKIKPKDTNQNGLIDTITLEFNNAIDHNSFQANDFIVNNNSADAIEPNADNSFNLITSDPEISGTANTSIEYNPQNSLSSSKIFEENFKNLNNLITREDTISPTITFTQFSNNPPKIGKNTVLLLFSETMNTSTYPQVSVQGENNNYELTPTSYTNNKYKGILTLPKNDIIDINKIIVLGAIDQSGNKLIDSPQTLHRVTIGDIDTNTPNAITTLSGEQINSKLATSNNTLITIKSDSNNVANNNIPEWKNKLNNKKTTNIYNKYTKTLLNNLKDLPQTNIDAITNFIAYGTPSTQKLGEGERAGILNSYKSAFSKLPIQKKEWEDLLKIGNGRWPNERSQKAENRAKASFNTIYKREANMNQVNDNAAITVMAYGLRPSQRNLNSEKIAISLFKKIFNYNPYKSTNWDAVRAIAYSGATR